MGKYSLEPGLGFQSLAVISVSAQPTSGSRGSGVDAEPLAQFLAQRRQAINGSWSVVVVKPVVPREPFHLESPLHRSASIRIVPFMLALFSVCLMLTFSPELTHHCIFTFYFIHFILSIYLLSINY